MKYGDRIENSAAVPDDLFECPEEYGEIERRMRSS
jgi:hypothetical protein